MNKYQSINTQSGILAGRDCIFLEEANFIHSERKLILKGSINNYISDKTLLDARFSKYTLTFIGTLAVKMIELDSWEESIGDDIFAVQSSFDEVFDSEWIEKLKLGGKVNSTHHHYLVLTYDDVFEIVCDKYNMKIEKIIESVN